MNVLTVGPRVRQKRKRGNAAHFVETRVVSGCCTMTYTIPKKWVESTRHEVFLNRLRAALGGFARSKRFARQDAPETREASGVRRIPPAPYTRLQSQRDCVLQPRVASYPGFA